MKILCVASVEDRANVDAQILKQTVKPDRTIIVVDNDPANTIDDRRIRIAHNQNKLRDIVKAYECDLVFQVEGDSILPDDCLERLIARYRGLKTYTFYPKKFGYISGNQIGRHGLYHIGAWVNFSDSHFESIDHTLTGVQEVEATGLYCLLASKASFLDGEVKWNGEPYGPDVVWSRSITAKQRRIFIDMDLEIGHQVKSGVIYPHHISTTTVKFDKNNGKWGYKAL